MRYLCPHDTSRLDHYGILNGNRVSNLRDRADPVLNIGSLQALIRIGKGAVNLFLDAPGLVDQFHQLADQNISLLIHQLISLPGKGQRVFRQHQISLGRKCTRIHNVPPFL